MTVTDVCVEDAEELLAIYAPYVLETAVSFELTPPSLDEFKERIVKISSKFSYLKAVDENGVILGFTYAAPFRTRAAYNWSVETTIYVRSDVRRTGVGRALYTELETRLRNMGILNLNSCVAYTEETIPHLAPDSVKFHEKMGYSLVGVFHKSGRKFNEWFDICWMEKLIGEHK